MIGDGNLKQFKVRANRGEGYIDIAILLLVVFLVLATVIKIYPVFVAKFNLNTFAEELLRVAEITGEIGTQTSQKEKLLEEQLSMKPEITWNAKYIIGTKRVQLNDEINVTLTMVVNIGLFGDFGSIPIELTSKATGRSEVYWKK